MDTPSADTAQVSAEAPQELQEASPAFITSPPSVVSGLPEFLRPFMFDSAKASAAARRRHELERLRKNPPQEKPADPRSALVAEQIELTTAILKDEKYCYCEHCKRGGVSPKDRAALNRSLCSLMDTQRILRGEPLPGSNRPSRKPSRESRPPVEPV